VKRNQSGHTILELLVVVAVLIVLAAIVLPSATVGDDRKLDTLQLALQDAIDHSQALSYHEGAPYGVRFSTVGQWFAVVNEVGVPIDDRLSHGDYLIRLKSPDMPKNCSIEHAMFGARPLAVFDSKGILMHSGQIRLRSGDTQRWLICDTATNRLVEVPPDSF